MHTFALATGVTTNRSSTLVFFHKWLKDFRSVNRITVSCANGAKVYGEGKDMTVCESAFLSYQLSASTIAEKSQVTKYVNF